MMSHHINASNAIEADLENVAVNGKDLTLEMIEEKEGQACSLSVDEVAFFEAVRGGKTEIVEELINAKHVDVNCKNYDGETALQIAVEDEAIEMMQILLRNKAEIGSALFQAVRNNSLQCVRALVANHPNIRRGTAPKTLNRATATTIEGISGSFDEFLTPLVLAVLIGNSEIVEFLISKGFKVEDPQLYKAENFDDKNEKETMIRLRESLVKLNTYRALANPLYIAHSFLHETRERKEFGKKSTQHLVNDPLFRSISLKKKLKDLSKKEGEFRDDYIELSDQSENFAIGLLDECRNLEEIAAVMDMPELAMMKKEVCLQDEEQGIQVLSLAIKYRNRKFIAHPYSQVMLNSVVYRGTHQWNHFSSLKRFFLALLYSLLMPLCMLGYILTPSNRVTKKLEMPLYKLLSHISSTMWFLAFVTMSAFQDKFDSFLRISPIPVLIGIWVFGITVQEIKKVKHQGVDRYLSEWWHLPIIPMIASYVLAAGLWLVGYALAVSDSGKWTVHVSYLLEPTSIVPYRLLLLSNSFYVLALVLTFFEASHFFQVNSVLGPLHLSIVMMVKDILRFLALFGLNVFAFALAMRKLYSQDVRTSNHMTGFKNGTESHRYQKLEGTLSTLFWALFGHESSRNFETNKNSEITEVTGILLFAGYSLASVLVMLNLLIAMLNNSYQKVAEEKDMNWKFSRTRIWMYYVSEVGPLPPPFNLIPVDKAASCIQWLAKRCWCINKCLGYDNPKETPSTRLKTNITNIKRRRVVLKNLIHRYFSGKDKTAKTEAAQVPFSKDTAAEEPIDEMSSSDEFQTKLMEVTRTLQTLQLAVKQFRTPAAKKEGGATVKAAAWSSGNN
ncbi:short transient receptor potential channel 4-like [Montipora capricornis]|uniref:short transient receptor potential channel 4-like n=1 Tax=Montipora capricornis TaxID=246305 RepID=UPI0035F15AB7